MRFHCGILVIIVMAGQPAAAAEPADPPALKHARVTDAPEACRGKLSVGDPPEASFISVQNPQVLPPRISAERIPLGIAGDYKPSLALLPGGEMLLVMFRNDSVGGGKIREGMIHYRSADGGRTW